MLRTKEMDADEFSILVFNVARARKYFRMVEEIIIRSKAALSRLP